MVLKDDIFNILNAKQFETVALKVFKYQFENNPVYRSYCDLLFMHPSDIKTLESIPFLPIQFFKTHHVICGDKQTEIIFSSSGTTGSVTSKHYVQDLTLYEESFTKAFELQYGKISDYVILGLLPSYLERSGSSLIYMVNHFIKNSPHPESNFYLNNLDELYKTLQSLEAQGKKTLLIGVSFALLDFVEQYQMQLKHTIVMETGGMKGRRKEMVRTELHEELCNGFGVNRIHSEYGMTELLSQAYSKGNGIFECPPWMKILIRDTEDALTILPENKNGGINIIDLANLNSCAFIATQDLGKLHANGHFEVIGRFDHSDVRGCNLMVM
ncbi:acyl transferase [Paucihalobacter ruber]|uniref:Acyl transferase n=1 Tax=Paucihalobacter ruber TaxID=2567861 RepID=A0A506PN35_9FLAO|nr:acyl transferase [Paucihalobacter ruber]TPV34625.1 acyl transferase [Paucihalobacter ruber]